MLFSHHLGWVKMEAQVAMAVLILSWAKLFQWESTALPHRWRGCLSSIFPFVSSRSNPTLYFRFISPCHLTDSKIHLCALSLSYSELTSLSPLCLCSRSLLPSFYLSPPSSPLDRHQLSLSLFFLCSFSIRVSRLYSCPSAALGVSAAMLAAVGECLAKWDLSPV